MTGRISSANERNAYVINWKITPMGMINRNGMMRDIGDEEPGGGEEEGEG